MAAVTRYINTASSAGGDGTTNATSGANRAYVSMREFIDSLPNSPTTLSDQYTVYCEGSAADTSDVYQSPWDFLTTATNYVIFIGEQSPRHPNFSTAKSGKYDTSLYRKEVTNSHGIYINLGSHIRFDGIQSKVTANDAGEYNAFRTTNGNQTASDVDCRCINCIAVGVVSGGSTVNGFQPGVPGSGGTSYIYNCLAYDCSQGFIGACAGGVFYNCTAADMTIGFVEDAATVCKNCLATNCTVGFVGTFTGSSNNAEDDGNGAPGTSSHSGTTFTFVNAASNDWHLASTDTGAKDLGVSDPGSGLFSDDIDGQTRSGSWDIGFDEYQAAGSSVALSGSASTSGRGTPVPGIEIPL